MSDLKTCQHTILFYLTLFLLAALSVLVFQQAGLTASVPVLD